MSAVGRWVLVVLFAAAVACSSSGQPSGTTTTSQVGTLGASPGVPWEWITADGAYDVTVLQPTSNPESECAWLVRVDTVVWSTYHLGPIAKVPFTPGQEFELLTDCITWPDGEGSMPLRREARIVTVSTMRGGGLLTHDKADQASLMVGFHPSTMQALIDGDPALSWLVDSADPSPEQLTQTLVSLLDELKIEFETGTTGPLLQRVAEWRRDHPRYMTDNVG